MRLARRSAVATVLLLMSFAVAAPAMADDNTASSAPPSSPGTACLDGEDGYGASVVCEMSVLTANAVCRGDVPKLEYAVVAEGAPSTTMTLTWGEQTGRHETVTDLPLSGSVLWPGTVVGANGTVTDWPGWSFIDGQWVQHDQWDWVRGPVPVTFRVGADLAATVSVALNTACADPPTATTQVLAEADPSDAVLAATGSSDATPLVLTAVGALLAGSLLLGLRAVVRRRQATR